MNAADLTAITVPSAAVACTVAICWTARRITREWSLAYQSVTLTAKRQAPPQKPPGPSLPQLHPLIPSPGIPDRGEPVSAPQADGSST